MEKFTKEAPRNTEHKYWLETHIIASIETLKRQKNEVRNR